jgi:hypothetical protein
MGTSTLHKPLTLHDLLQRQLDFLLILSVNLNLFNYELISVLLSCPEEYIMLLEVEPHLSYFPIFLLSDRLVIQLSLA